MSDWLETEDKYSRQVPVRKLMTSRIKELLEMVEDQELREELRRRESDNES